MGNGYIITDRQSRLTTIMPLPKRTTQAAIIALRRHPHRAITANNDGEFTHHRFITQALGVPVFFADPGEPW